MKVCVVGGGASGMAAAIRLAKAGAKVTLFEKNDRVGKKILSTGNGKCNLGNMDISVEHYYSSDLELLNGFLSAFDQKETIYFFHTLGMMTKNKNGYLYPYGEQASLVLDVLRYGLELYGVTVVVDSSVNNVLFLKEKQQFEVITENGKHRFDKVVIATGGKAAPKTGSDGWGYGIARSFGHRIIPVIPALHPLKCQEEVFKTVAGVRAEASLGLYDENGKFITERGELQLIATGISGIPVFQISRIVGYLLKQNKQIPVHIDFYPDITKQELLDTVKEKVQLYSEQTVEAFLAGFLNKKLMLLFAKLAGIKGTDLVKTVSDEKLCKLVSIMKHWTVTVIEGASFDQAQVTAGGIPLSELSSYLESKLQKGLYFIGEVVDVDGVCGGYNLHWAWCSAHIASEGILKE